MSGYPIVLEGESIRALVVGGGSVGERKARALLEAGATVDVVAPQIAAGLEELSRSNPRLRVTRGTFAPGHLDAKTLVFAATNDAGLNADVARQARDRGIAVNVADAPELGTFVTTATHRAGDVIVSVSAGGVPAAAARIRDVVARTIDHRFADAVRELSGVRRTMLDRGDRDRWRAASTALLGDRFVDDVSAGVFAARLDEWR